MLCQNNVFFRYNKSSTAVSVLTNFRNISVVADEQSSVGEELPV